MVDEIFRPLHLAISVSDAETAIKWFEDILSFELLRKAEAAVSGLKVAFMSNRDGFEIEIFQHKEYIELPPDRLTPSRDNQICGTKHIAFITKDVDELATYFNSKNVEIVMGPMEAFGMYVMFIHGPDNILIEFIQKKCDQKKGDTTK